MGGNHLSALGFEVNTLAEFMNLVAEVAKGAEGLPCENGFLIPCRLGEGVEVWARADKDRVLRGGEFHFGGQSRMNVSFQQLIPDPNCLDGLLFALTIAPDSLGGTLLLSVLPDSK
ncbi:MAG: hypothetical protein ACYDCC_09735 [Actinomycetota bacterium]